MAGSFWNWLAKRINSLQVKDRIASKWEKHVTLFRCGKLYEKLEQREIHPLCESFLSFWKGIVFWGDLLPPTVMKAAMWQPITEHPDIWWCHMLFRSRRSQDELIMSRKGTEGHVSGTEVRRTNKHQPFQQLPNPLHSNVFWYSQLWPLHSNPSPTVMPNIPVHRERERSKINNFSHLLLKCPKHENEMSLFSGMFVLFRMLSLHFHPPKFFKIHFGSKNGII